MLFDSPKSRGNESTMIEFSYKVCAVIFGTDETLLSISLNNGFMFVKRSLHPKDCLDKNFELSDFGLRREYETARINNDTLDVICIEKQTVYSFYSYIEAENFFSQQVETDLVELDNQIRAIRLIKECALRCKAISFRLKSINSENPSEFCLIHPVSESWGCPEISVFHCDDNEVSLINSQVKSISFPFTSEILNVAHRYYDLSYLVENYIALTLLIVALEMVFLNNETAKKQRLAKRCAMLMSDEKTEQNNCFSLIIDAYEQRSDFVHEGIFTGIEDAMILSLRNCVRKVLLSEHTGYFDKKPFISHLRAKVSTAESTDPDYFGG